MMYYYIFYYFLIIIFQIMEWWSEMQRISYSINDDI